MPVLRINDHDMYYEIHGSGPNAVCMGGWGTFCHGDEGKVSRVLMKNYRVLLFDYRGIGDSTDTPDATPSTDQYASDVAGLLDALGWTSAAVVGLVGMGACVGQKLAIMRPDLVDSLFMTGTWTRPDKIFADQLELFRKVHLQLGFYDFQLMAAALSFDPGFYEMHRDRILGPDGAWGALRGRAEAHARLIEACLTHDVTSQMDAIKAPTYVLHAGADVLTGPRLTLPLERGIEGAEGVVWDDLAHVVAGKEQKIQFDQILGDFLARAEGQKGTKNPAVS